MVFDWMPCPRLGNWLAVGGLLLREPACGCCGRFKKLPTWLWLGRWYDCGDWKAARPDADGPPALGRVAGS